MNHAELYAKMHLFFQELERSSFDIVTAKTASYPYSSVYIHEPKMRVDMSKYIDTHRYLLDHTFDESASNAQVYKATVEPLVDGLFDSGMCTFFAYGQTGRFRLTFSFLATHSVLY
jgi:hypothetical protein